MSGVVGTRPMWPLVMGGLQGMMEIGRGGACVPARAPYKGASIVRPRAQCMYFWYGNAAARTFGRACLSAFPPAMTTSKGWQK